MTGPHFPIYQSVRQRGFLSPKPTGYEYYAHLDKTLPRDHDFHDSNPLKYPPYAIEEMITSGEKYMTVLHVDPTLPPIYAGSIWDHIDKERFTNTWWEQGTNAIDSLSHLPFDEMWVEFDVPNNRPQDGHPPRVPMACTYHLVADSEPTGIDFAVVTVFIESNVVPMLDADTGRRGNLLIPMAIGGVALDPDNPQVPRVGWSAYHWGLAVDCVLDALNVVAMLGRFLNCRNVELVEVLPKTIASNPKKRRKRLSDPSRTRYRVVHVEPVGKRRRGHSASASATTAKRQHMRRGHFKTYGPDAPLFGRITGTYWWGPALCGGGGGLEQAWDMSSLIVKPEEVE